MLSQADGGEQGAGSREQGAESGELKKDVFLHIMFLRLGNIIQIIHLKHSEYVTYRENCR
jgi:hypothetical protein